MDWMRLDDLEADYQDIFFEKHGEMKRRKEKEKMGFRIGHCTQTFIFLGRGLIPFY